MEAIPVVRIYAGNNKAIVQVFKKDLIKSFRLPNSFVLEYYAVDLSTKSAIKPNIPLTKQSPEEQCLLETGKLLIVGNTGKRRQ